MNGRGLDSVISNSYDRDQCQKNVCDSMTMGSSEGYQLMSETEGTFFSPLCGVLFFNLESFQNLIEE